MYLKCLVNYILVPSDPIWESPWRATPASLSVNVPHGPGVASATRAAIHFRSTPNVS